MSKTRKPEKMYWGPRIHSLVAWSTLGLAWLPALAGCSTTAPATHTGDPLYGEYYPKGPNGQPMPPPATPHKTTSAAGVPPFPLANSSASTAAIANNTELPGGRPLAINEKGGTNWALTNNPGSPARAPVVVPVPRDNTVPGPITQAAPANLPGTIVAAGSWSSGPATPVSSGPVAPLGMVTPDVLQGTLQGKGAVGLKQETVPDGVRVSCYVPQHRQPRQPSLSRNHCP